MCSAYGSSVKNGNHIKKPGIWPFHKTADMHYCLHIPALCTPAVDAKRLKMDISLVRRKLCDNFSFNKTTLKLPYPINYSPAQNISCTENSHLIFGNLNFWLLGIYPSLLSTRSELYIATTFIWLTLCWKYAIKCFDWHTPFQ